VAECGVVGSPDAERGTVVKAFVVLKPGHPRGADIARQLQDYVKNSIAPYKYPRVVEFVDALAAHRDRQAAALQAEAMTMSDPATRRAGRGRRASPTGFPARAGWFSSAARSAGAAGANGSIDRLPGSSARR